MKLKDKPSKSVYDGRGVAQKSDREQTGEHIFHEMMFKDAVDKVSQQFDRSINPGKGDRQNGPDSPITKFLKKKSK